MRLLNFLAQQKWAITEEYLRAMEGVYYAWMERKAAGEKLDKEALEKQLGRKLDNTRTVSIRDGVATIPVEGAIFRYADWFGDISGGTTFEVLATDFNAAMDNPDVRDIVLYINSPGGEVDGTNEFSNMIYEARGQGKRIVAYVSHDAASAAYWIASAADEVVIDDTATIGCIGVILGVGDPSKEDGRRRNFISSQTPHKRPDPNKEKGADQIQTVADDLAQVFIDTVARNRGVTSAEAEQNFCSQWLFVGQKAVDAGLADRVGSYESVLAELQGDASGVRASSDKNMRASLSDNGDKTMAEKNWIQKLFAGLSSDERKEAVAALNQTGEDGEESAEVKALRAKAARAEKYEAAIREARASEAKAFAGSLVTGKVLLPAAMAKVEALYIQHAQDDETSPLATVSRVEQFKAMFEGLPKHHLCAEMTETELPTGAVVLNPDQGTQEESLKKAEDSSRAYAAKTNGKSNLREVSSQR